MAYLPNPQCNVQTSIPIAGASIAMGLGVECYVSVPAGTLATLTYTLPSAPPDGTRFIGSSTQAITSFTLSSQGSDSFVGAPAALTANVAFEVVYIRANTTWYRIR